MIVLNEKNIHDCSSPANTGELALAGAIGQHPNYSADYRKQIWLGTLEAAVMLLFCLSRNWKNAPLGLA